MKQIAVSKFADLGFCELKIVHHFIEERKPMFHPNVFLGGKQHAVSEREDALKPRVSVTLQEVLEALRDGESVLEFPSESVRVEFAAHGFLFSGRLDKLVKKGLEAVVLDEKFTSGGDVCLQFREKYARQLQAYCYGLAKGRTLVNTVALGEKVFSGLKLFGKVVERDIGDRRQLGEPIAFEFVEDEFTPSLARFAEIMKGGIEAKELACGKLERCALCEYKGECENRAY